MRALLLDSHIANAVAAQLRERAFDAIALAEWHGGSRLHFPDAELLRLAAQEERTLVSFDVRTIPWHTRFLAEMGEDHAGVIFVSRRTFEQDDVGGLVRSLERFVRHELPADMTNQVLFLPRR